MKGKGLFRRVFTSLLIGGLAAAMAWRYLTPLSAVVAGGIVAIIIFSFLQINFEPEHELTPVLEAAMGEKPVFFSGTVTLLREQERLTGSLVIASHEAVFWADRPGQRRLELSFHPWDTVILPSRKMQLILQTDKDTVHFQTSEYGRLVEALQDIGFRMYEDEPTQDE